MFTARDIAMLSTGGLIVSALIISIVIFDENKHKVDWDALTEGTLWVFHVSFICLVLCCCFIYLSIGYGN